ncbi:MAG: hypothetical protein ABSC51_00730 [Gaiellaceae bacterium]|jgi:hypothetical protein
MRRISYLAVLALAFVVVSVGLLAGCGTSTAKGNHTFSGHGVSFHYPRSWKQVTLAGESAQNAGGTWTETFQPPSSSKADVLFVSQYQTPVAITEKTLSTYAKNVTASVENVASQAGGSVLAGPTQVSMGGLPGYEYRISAKTIHGFSSESRILLVWNGTTEYYLNCQHQTGGSSAKEIERGCKMVIESFKAS